MSNATDLCPRCRGLRLVPNPDWALCNDAIHTGDLKRDDLNAIIRFFNDLGYDKPPCGKIECPECHGTGYLEVEAVAEQQESSTCILST